MTMPPRIAPPPRRVPLSLKLATILGGVTQIGLVVFAFGMPFFWVFAGQADLSFVTMRGDVARTDGRVTQVESTGASENEATVMANHYEYSVAGQRLTGTSYTTGSSASPGQAVTVEYKPDEPVRSRIEGMRTGVFGSGAFVSAIFPLVGLLIVVFAARRGVRRAHLLSNGQLASGRLIDRRPTNMQVNRQTVWELTFEFTARDGRRSEAKVRTHQTARLEDEQSEPLLYDPENPSRAYFLDEVPARPSFDGTGELEGRPVAALLVLVVPAVLVAMHVWYFMR